MARSVDGLNAGLQAAAERMGAGKLAEAVELCRQMVRQFPKEAKVFYALGVALIQIGRFDEGRSAYVEAVRLKPDFYEARLNLGTVLTRLNRPAEAIEQLKEASRLQPRAAEVWVNLSTAQRDDWQIEEAIASAKRAIIVNEVLPEGRVCLGAALASKGEYDRAIGEYRQAIGVRPEYAVAHLNLALALLATGNLAEGFGEYEWRKKCGAVPQARAFSQPAWNGEEISGKTILLHPEQGFGDAIHFIRYVPLLKKMGATVWVECAEPLMRLLIDLPGVDRIFISGKAEMGFDVQCALPSLAHAFRTTVESIPGDTPYIAADKREVKRWEKKIARDERMQVGIAWSGNSGNRNDRNRSISLDRFARLGESAKNRLHSLQVAPPPENSGVPLADWSEELLDFADTVGLIANLDLVISVDTAVAHLAGAMGKKVWVLLPAVADWRWLQGRSDSPWYPTMQLFRQTTAGDWDEVMRRLPTDQF